MKKIRQYSLQAGSRVKDEGLANNLVELIASDPDFGMSLQEIEDKLEPKNYIGCSARQVEDFLRDVVLPALAPYADQLGIDAQLKV